MKHRVLDLIENISALFSRGSHDARKTFYELEKLGYQDSAAFIYEHGRTAMLLRYKEQFWDFALARIPDTGLLLEFGVFEGNSINYFARQLAKRDDTRPLYGFDSFEGLSEDWAGTAVQAATFDLRGQLPAVEPRVSLVKGWIDQTLPGFLNTHVDPAAQIAFLHVDMDTYSPTRIIFEQTVGALKPGTVIVFDELLGYSGWRDNEYKALMECIAPVFEFEFIAFCEPLLKYRRVSKYVRAAVVIGARM